MNRDSAAVRSRFRGPTRRALRGRIERYALPSILEVKHRPDGTTETAPCSVLARGDDEVLLYHELTARWTVGPITIAPPMFTLAWYGRERPHNAYTWFAADGRTVGTYFNVVAPHGYVLDDRELHYHDRHVDVLALPDGTTTLLDLDELATLPVEERIAARAAADRVVARADEYIEYIYDRIEAAVSDP